jgi:hypothetical protein
LRVVGKVSRRTIASVEAGEDCWYLLLKAALTASTVASSVAGTARTGKRSLCTCSAPSRFDEISRYQRPLWPRTERTKLAFDHYDPDDRAVLGGMIVTAGLDAHFPGLVE